MPFLWPRLQYLLLPLGLKKYNLQHNNGPPVNHILLPATIQVFYHTKKYLYTFTNGSVFTWLNNGQIRFFWIDITHLMRTSYKAMLIVIEGKRFLSYRDNFANVSCWLCTRQRLPKNLLLADLFRFEQRGFLRGLTLSSSHPSKWFLAIVYLIHKISTIWPIVLPLRYEGAKHNSDLGQLLFYETVWELTSIKYLWSRIKLKRSQRYLLEDFLKKRNFSK